MTARYSLVTIPSLFIAVFIVCSCFPAQAVRAELVHGVADLALGGFDFSTQEYVNDISNPAADLWYAYVFEPPIGYLLYTGENYSLIRAEPDSTLEEIVWAPADPMQYAYDAVPAVGGVYLVKTSDGYYAKFLLVSVTDETSIVIEYYVQMDGTQNLDSVVPVSELTWGQLKSKFVSN